MSEAFIMNCGFVLAGLIVVIVVPRLWGLGGFWRVLAVLFVPVMGYVTLAVGKFGGRALWPDWFDPKVLNGDDAVVWALIFGAFVLWAGRVAMRQSGASR